MSESVGQNHKHLEPPRISYGFAAVNWAILVATALIWLGLTIWMWDYVMANAVGWAAACFVIYGLCLWGAGELRRQTTTILKVDGVIFGRGERRSTIPWSDAEVRWDGVNYIIRSGSSKLRINQNFYDPRSLFKFFQLRFPEVGRDRKRFHRASFRRFE